MKKEYRAYTDKGKMAQKRRDLGDIFKEAERDLRQTARTREQSVHTAKLLYQLADSALRVCVEKSLSEQEQTESQDENVSLAVC